MYSFFLLSTVLPAAIAAPQSLWPRYQQVSHAANGSIDFTPWSLQLPIGDPGHPETISSDELQSGYSDPNKEYFYEDGDVLVMKVPGSPDSTGCVTTPNSLHCRTELRESSPDKWDPTASTNVLKATLTVITADDSKYGTVVGQIHIDDDISSKPVCELYYNEDGTIQMGVEQTRDGGNSKYTTVGNVPVGTEFSYEIHYEGGELSVVINGDETQLDQYELDNPESYFKAGNYNQGDSASEVHFTAISVEHSS
ncbi:MAG: hypothetical protein MMC23_002362 [Stictis urceolatum]|nr:hypothetical protein [Stictis urceolata]